MSTESVQNYLGKVNSWGRYQSAFNLLWQKLQLTEESWRSLSLSQVASALISLHMQSPCQARNAYSAALLGPGFSQLRFLPVLQPYKRQWNSSVEKYATFWSPLSLLQQLVAEPLRTSPTIVALRDILLICCRLLLLHRSIDLARVLRKTSVVDGVPFLLIQRKGWSQHKWGKILNLLHLTHVSPWHLIVQYVRATAHLVPAGPSC